MATTVARIDQSDPAALGNRIGLFAMTQYPATRTATSSPPSSGGIDIKTLAITAASSAAAAFVCSRVWASGTLAAAAFTPVLVAVIREALDKSTEVVVKAVPVRGVVRSAEPEGLQPLQAASPEWAAEESPLAGEDPAGRVAQPGAIAYHRAGGGGRKWRIAIVTGLLGFLIAAVLFTVPELVAGRSASGGGRDTTLFGGRESSTPAVTTTTTTAPTKTVTTAPQRTVTVPPQTVTTPAPAVPTPVPQESTTTPAPTTTTPTEPPPAQQPPPPEAPPG